MVSEDPAAGDLDSPVPPCDPPPHQLEPIKDEVEDDSSQLDYKNGKTKKNFSDAVGGEERQDMINSGEESPRFGDLKMLMKESKEDTAENDRDNSAALVGEPLSGSEQVSSESPLREVAPVSSDEQPGKRIQMRRDDSEEIQGNIQDQRIKQ